MDTPFTPKTHISKRIKIWAIVLLAAVILASGLAILTGGKTRLFKGTIAPEESITKIIETYTKLTIDASIHGYNKKLTPNDNEVEILDLKFITEYTLKLHKIILKSTGTATSDDFQLFLDDKEIKKDEGNDTYEKVFSPADEITPSDTYSLKNIKIKINPNISADKTLQLEVAYINYAHGPVDLNISNSKIISGNISIGPSEPTLFLPLDFNLNKIPPEGIVNTTPTLSVTVDEYTPQSTNVSQGQSFEIMKLNITAENGDITLNRIQLQVIDGKNAIEKISLVTGIDNKEIEMTPQTNPDYYAADNLNINLTINSTPGTYIIIKAYIKQNTTTESIKFSIPYATYIQTTADEVTGEFPITSKNFSIKKEEQQQITPKLTIKIDPATPKSQSVAGGTNVEATKLLLTTADEDVEIKQLTITRGGDIKDKTNIDITMLGLTLLDEKDTKLAEILTVPQPQLEVAYLFNLQQQQDKWIIPKNSTRKLIITAAINKKAPENNTFQLGILSNLAVTASVPNENIKVGEDKNPLISSVMGNLFTIIPAEQQPTETGQPKLTLSIPTDAPKNGNVKQGETKETAKFTLKAENGDIPIHSVDISVISNNKNIKSIEATLQPQNITHQLTKPTGSPFYLLDFSKNNITLKKDAPSTLSIKTGIKDDATLNETFQIGIKNIYTAYNTGANISTDQPLVGSIFTIVPAEKTETGTTTDDESTLNVTATPQGNDSFILQGTSEEILKLDLQANNVGPIIVKNLKLSLATKNAITQDDLPDISLNYPEKPELTWPLSEAKLSADGSYSVTYKVDLEIPANTTKTLSIKANTKQTALAGVQFTFKITSIEAVTNTGGQAFLASTKPLFSISSNELTIIALDKGQQPTPAGAQLTVSKPIPEIQAGLITAGSSTDVLKLKFQAPADSNITVNNIKFTIEGTAVLNDIQTIKLMDGINVIGSSTDAAFTKISDTVYTTTITVPLALQANQTKELTLNVTAKSGAVISHSYLFRIQQESDISTPTANVYLNPAPLSSQTFTIAGAAGAGTGTSSTPSAPTVSVSASPTSSQTSGQIVTFTVTVNNGPGGSYNYSLDLGDGKTTKTQASTAASATFDHTYSEAKTYTVKGSVTMAINGTSQTIASPNLGYTITTVAVAPPPPVSPEITNLQNQLALLQQQLANAQSSQSSQSTAQIQTLTQQIAQLAALAAAKQEPAKSASGKEPAKKSKTPVETPEMWGAGPVAPVQPTQTYIPPVQLPAQPPAPAYLAAAPGAAPMYYAAPSLGYSQKLVKVPEKSNTGPEVLVYFIAVGAANAAWWIKRKFQYPNSK